MTRTQKLINSVEVMDVAKASERLAQKHEIINVNEEDQRVIVRDDLPPDFESRGQQTTHAKCDCLERLNLKIENELDRLRGLFRKKEMDLFHPYLSRFNKVEEWIERVEQRVEQRFREHEEAMMI